MAPGLADFKCKCFVPSTLCPCKLTCHADSVLGFFLVSGLITIVRIALRLQKRMFWWDDFWAAVALISYTTFVPGELNHAVASPSSNSS